MMTEMREKIKKIAVPESPEIPGLIFRSFRGEADFPEMVAVIEGSKKHDQGERVFTVEEFSTYFQHLDNCDPYRDMLFAEIDGQVIGYSRVEWQKESRGSYYYRAWGIILPAWRNQGIGTAMLKSNEKHLRKIAQEHPQGAAKYFRAGASENEKEATALLKRFGYQPERYFYDMVRSMGDPLPSAPMPEGLEIRPVTDDQLPTIFAGLDEAFQDHWGHTPLTENNIKNWMKHPTFNPSLWKVAWEGDQVAGMVGNFIDQPENEANNRQRGWTEDIWVRRPWRRQGLARALLVESIQMLEQMNMTETALGVDTVNPSGALNLYESVGYCKNKLYTVYNKSL